MAQRVVQFNPTDPTEYLSALIVAGVLPPTITLYDKNDVAAEDQDQVEAVQVLVEDAAASQGA